MQLRIKQLAALGILAFLLVGQFHVWSELDPCLWSPNAGHRGASHNSHGCQNCVAGNWAALAPRPGLGANMHVSRLELAAPAQAPQSDASETSAPRAPPQ